MMINLFKSIPLGGLLTWLVCMFAGGGGARGGQLNIRPIEIMGESVMWSWPLFGIGTLLAWGVMSLQK